MYYDFDRLGNLWTLDGAGKSQLGYADYSGFGGTIASGGSGTVFGYGGANGCQTEADTGLVLMGHRYYDSRIGRFLTQDPAGDGNNWYAYAGNNPVNKTDPSGLMPLMSFPEGSSPQGTDQPIWATAEAEAFGVSSGTHTWREWYDVVSINGGPAQEFDTGVKVVGSDTYSITPVMFGCNTGSVTQMRSPSKLQQLLAGLLIGLAKPGVHVGPVTVHLPQPPPRQAKPGKTVEEKDGDKPAGSKFSMHNFENNMRWLQIWGNGAMYDINRAAKQQQSYSPFTWGGGAWVWE